MKWTVSKKAAQPVRILLLAVYLACASTQMQTAATPRDTNDFVNAVSPVYDKAMQVATVPDAIIIDILPNTYGQNNLVYTPSELHVPPGTRVAWVSWRGRFTLVLHPHASSGPWPFTEPAGDITPVNNSPPYRAVRTLQTGLASGAHYHFTVDLFDAAGTTLGHDPDCPPIIIN